MFNRNHDQEAEYRAIRKEEREAGIAEGFQRGIEQGIAEGIEQKALDVVQKMLTMGISIEDIAKTTDLSIEDVQVLL